ncbi:Prefoldin beta-like protein [Vararia minispora EC-137]|uniref:Prefoldin beta-like protein n=1 Tax=Vararia minispora EC-137 TaxID=1314806 RepID=A0ACB8QCP5_9AGAM|nr:Prefoldin beta-like protein [Vararia minispora EC-137]
MRMLGKDEEADEGAEVSWGDQQKINSFSKLNTRMRSLTEKMEVLKQEKEALDDLALELELADEDDPVMYRIGEAFVHMSHVRAMKRLSSDQKAVNAALEELGSRVDECASEMKELKITLYAKFGSAINLDE